MVSMPTDRGFDSTLALLVQGYDFISTRCERYGSDVFTTRLLLEPNDLPAGAGCRRGGSQLQ